MSKINFVRASLTKTRYATTFLNKTRKKSINTTDESENYVLTTQETPITCITAEQDFNYFLAKGTGLKIEVNNCQIGFPFSSLITTNSTFFKHLGGVSYTIKPGTITRSSLILYGKYTNERLISSTTFYLADLTLSTGNSTTFYLSGLTLSTGNSTTYSFT